VKHGAGERQNVGRRMLNLVHSEDVRDISPALRSLLEAELAHGNEVAQTWRGWPESRSVCVMLRRPFTRATREASGLEYHLVADPHYRGEELFDRASAGLLCVEWSDGFRPR